MLMVYRINFAYLDFGDGNYLYISQRLADGLRLYRDIISPQPPLHLAIGSLLVSLSDDVETKITVVRTYSILLHLGAMLLVVAVTYTIWGVARTATLAGLIYLVLPLGLWWGQGFQSEPLLLIFLLSSFLALLQGNSVGLALGAIASVLGCFTNMTFLPYLGLHSVYVIARHRKDGLWPWFFLPLLVLGTAGFSLCNTISDGAYVENVWSNQVGSFPSQGAVRYAIQKITLQGLEVLQHEGAFILLALMGMLSQWRHHAIQAGISTQYVVWFGLASLGSLVFVAKGGTVQYIFTLGEPMVAVFAAHFLYRMHEEYLTNSLRHLGAVAAAGRVAIIVTMTFVLALPTYVMTLRMASDDLPMRVYERSHQEVFQVIRDIERHSPAKGLILAPPFYAFVSGRRLAGECPETFLIGIRYYNEYLRLCEMLNTYPQLVQSLPPTTRTGVSHLQAIALRRKLATPDDLDLGLSELVERIAVRLRQREVHYVLMNVEPRQAFSYIVELWEAMDGNYVRLPVERTPGEPQPESDQSQEFKVYRGREEILWPYAPVMSGFPMSKSTEKSL